MSMRIKFASVALRSNSALAFALIFFVCSFFLQSAAGAGAAQQADDKAATPSSSGAALNPVLVELFTSEGCSSCPPVDRLVQKWDAGQPIQGAQLIILSEHVTYWDHDGWKDPNSSAQLTDRQNDYEHVLGEQTSFTPQIIVDGTHELRPNNPQEMKNVLVEAAATPKIPVRIASVTTDASDPNVLRAHIETDANPDKKNADVYVAVALDHFESQVLKGENGGKHLDFVAVVQELTKVGKLQKGKNFSEDVQLKLKPGTDPKNIRLIAFVQESGQGKMLGAALRKPSELRASGM